MILIELKSHPINEKHYLIPKIIDMTMANKVSASSIKGVVPHLGTTLLYLNSVVSMNPN